MRLRSKLFYVFLAVLLIVASIVEASKRRQGAQEEEKKGKGKKSGLTTPSGSDGGTLVERNSGPSLESEKARENKASVGVASSTVEGGRSEVVSSAVSENGAESDDALGEEMLLCLSAAIGIDKNVDTLISINLAPLRITLTIDQCQGWSVHFFKLGHVIPCTDTAIFCNLSMLADCDSRCIGATH